MIDDFESDYPEDVADSFIMFGDNGPGSLIIFLIIFLLLCLYFYYN